MTGATAVSHVFAGIPTADLAAAVPWYERFFHRPPDGRPHATEAVWELADGGRCIWSPTILDPDGNRVSLGNLPRRSA